MNVFSSVEAFLLKCDLNHSPLLLALSGGPDSLCLFYALLDFRKKHGIPFHAAHIDHGWRPESGREASELQKLAAKHQVPFHLHLLNPLLLKGNLEAACREERYGYFAALFQTIPFQALLTGHHRDDLAETVFKRLLEGAHWSRWTALEHDTILKGVRVLRPLLKMTKKEIMSFVIDSQSHFSAFDDPTNRERRFLRARLREEIFPWLNREFGKEVRSSLAAIGEEAKELTGFFDARLSPLLEEAIEGPWGICLDLQAKLPASLLELKYLLRLFCRQSGFFLSREIVDQAARALLSGKGNQQFLMGSHQVWIDRKRIFLAAGKHEGKESFLFPQKPLMLELLEMVHAGKQEKQFFGDWKIEISRVVFNQSCKLTNWKEGWKGALLCYLPIQPEGKKGRGDAEIDLSAVKKKWSQAKIPVFLTSYFPLITQNSAICHEFLTGKPMNDLSEGEACWRIDLAKEKS